MEEHRSLRQRFNLSPDPVLSAWHRQFAQHNAAALVVVHPSLPTDLNEYATQSSHTVSESLHRDNVKRLREIVKEMEDSQWMLDP